SGADKISVNSIAIKDKSIISRAADKFGSQCVVLAIDAKKTPLGNYNVFINGGRIDTGIDAVEWAVNGAKLGAGEILLTSMDADGTKDGFDLEITKKICDAVNIPVIASGGCGKLSDFAEVFKKTNCDAALAASLFHYGELTIGEVKEYLKSQNINVR
ncbi:MAG: HisA/HisF-related TIM barrel protein, partial [Clostridia bacterium]